MRGVACDGENASFASHHVPNNAADQMMSPVTVFCRNGNAATRPRLNPAVVIVGTRCDG